MEKLFGIPLAQLAVVLVVLVVIAVAIVGVLALRNRIFFKLGVRNVARRRGRTALIVLGLMLGTAIISAALSTGDTMSSTIRSLVVGALGHTDEIVSVKGADTEEFESGASESVGYFDESQFVLVKQAAAGEPLIDGVAPAIMEPVAVQDVTSEQNEPRVMLFASDASELEGFAPIVGPGGAHLSLASLEPGEVYLTDEAAEELSAAAGDELRVFAGGTLAEVRVSAVVEFDGHGGEGPAMLMPLEAAQSLLGREGLIMHVLVSNVGDDLSGAAHSDDVVAALRPTVAELGLQIDPIKQDALDLADDVGTIFMSFFTTFGSFSIVAGILLIFLIFVMLAGERRSEMGISRAVGTQRRHLVQMFLFEGLAYDLVAAAVGALLGLGVAYGMVLAMAAAFGSAFEIDIRHDLNPQSLIVAYTLGVLLTFLVVVASAWRVSRLNIVSAIRNLPERAKARGRSRRLWVLALLAAILGVFVAASGVSQEQATPWYLGVSIVIIALMPLLRGLGVPDRVAYTFGGLALVVWWLLPLGTFDALLPDLGVDFTIFILGGLMVVIGAVWVLMYNADLVLGTIASVLGRVRGLAPILRLAIAHPLKSRFRTGMVIALFTLVVLTLTVGTTTSGAFNDAFDDQSSFAGGFDIRAVSAPISPIDNIHGSIAGSDAVSSIDFDTTAGQATVFAQAHQTRTANNFETYPVLGFEPGFLVNTDYGLGARAEGYASDAEVWQAMASEQGLAVIDALAVQRRDNFNFGVAPAFQLEGFYLEDETFTPVPVQIRDPETNTTIDLLVIGVLRDTVAPFMTGLSTSRATLEPFGAKARPDTYWFQIAPELDATEMATRLESAFLANGLEAEAMADSLDDQVGASRTFNWIIQGFMGLGLIVGVAGLGVITARSVVERRKEIGVLRSIGFRRQMVQLSFLVESTFIAVTAIVVGAGLGLIMARNVIVDASSSPSYENIAFAPPWMNLAIIFGAVYIAALATTLIPARRASRIPPAEALRYE